MLATEKEPLRTAAAKLTKSRLQLTCAVPFQKEYKAAPGSKLATKYLQVATARTLALKRPPTGCCDCAGVTVLV